MSNNTPTAQPQTPKQAAPREKKWLTESFQDPRRSPLSMRPAVFERWWRRPVACSKGNRSLRAN